MKKIFHYQIKSIQDGSVTMSVKFPEFMLESFLTYLGVKEKQSPTFTVEERAAQRAKIYKKNVDAVCLAYDKAFPVCDSVPATISKTLSNLKINHVNFNYDTVRTILRRSGRLKGTRL
jgi:hypothetical protein